MAKSLVKKRIVLLDDEKVMVLNIVLDDVADIMTHTHMLIDWNPVDKERSIELTEVIIKLHWEISRENRMIPRDPAVKCNWL